MYLIFKFIYKGERTMKRMKKFLAVMLTLILSVSLLPTINTNAAAKPKIAKSMTVYLYPKATSPYTIPVSVKNATPNGTIKKLKSSETSVATVMSFGTFFEVNPVSEGTTKVTFNYEGKKLSTKVKVVKYENPCKTFKVGKKNFAKNFKKTNGYLWGNHKKDITAKIEIAPKSGWKLVKIIRSADWKMTKVKNKSKVQFTKDFKGFGIIAYFKNKKTKVVEKVWLGYGPEGEPSKNIVYR